MKEESLSGKIRYTHNPTRAYEGRTNTGNVIKVIKVEDVKQAVQKLKEKIREGRANFRVISMIDEIFGDKLTGGENGKKSREEKSNFR